MSLIDKNGLKIALDGVKAVMGNKQTEINKNSKSIKELNSRISSVEKAGTALPNVFISGNLDGISKYNKVTVKIEYHGGSTGFSTHADMKWQGTSSLGYPKKNFSITLHEKVNVGWGEQSKYVLKANYIDASHTRNIVSARLWSDIVRSRSDYDTLPEELKAAPNHGAVDGFPVNVYINGAYQGLYTWNIPKDAWTFNMDSSSDMHGAMCGEDYNSGAFNAEWSGVDGDGWSDEVHNTTPANIVENWKNAVLAAYNYADVESYFDINSVIDYFIYGMVSCGIDSRGKNQIYLTYNGGQTWYASMYDMDSTWGLYWDGSQFVPADYEDYEDVVHNGYMNSLYEACINNYWPEIISRYAELRKGPLSLANINKRFAEFINLISTEAYNEDNWIWLLPSANKNNIYQLRQYIYDRILYCDEVFGYVADDTNPSPTGGMCRQPESFNIIKIFSTAHILEATPGDCTIDIPSFDKIIENIRRGEEVKAVFVWANPSDLGRCGVAHAAIVQYDEGMFDIGFHTKDYWVGMSFGFNGESVLNISYRKYTTQ